MNTKRINLEYLFDNIINATFLTISSLTVPVALLVLIGVRLSQ